MHSSSIYNSQDMEIAQVSIDSWMDEEDIIYTYTHTHTHTVEYYSAIKRMK